MDRRLTNNSDIGQHEITSQQQLYTVQNYIASLTIRTLRNHTIEKRATKQGNLKGDLFYVDPKSLKFDYWNIKLGQNAPVNIEFGNEKKINKHWIPGRPLKLLTHGYVRSINNIETTKIKSGYIATGNYNIITLDWSEVSKDISYFIPAYLTVRVGSIVAQFLENIVTLGLIEPSDIHLIGHSLGAHLFGATGGAFTLGKIGRITGLDPAGIGFETFFIVETRHLNVADAQFVDVIHTSVGSIFGFAKPMGHVDFYANLGLVPQPQCEVKVTFLPFLPFAMLSQSICSHFRACQYYADSIYNGKSFMAVQCFSAKEYMNGRCENNPINFMGNDVDFGKKGSFYLKAQTNAPAIGFMNVIFDYVKRIFNIS
ncbi:Triacylglycerol lipase family,Lipase/vitellogenin,Alpha/Beta hydrolase fold [Cinara cedri]|uniref:Triacylglycerol lipase family,Lipase/vitellogenin,Alpha/Beta hydrolase fold n=1 Tax=Cinara cedri TaxID=506608 RepID=A0A5E4MWH3_9HEMI|nr:Triacylglycerol lipase family,Lipase/vitellogenin,Alpha/Beta hydrolase fold [Cinara cedri]